MQGTNTSGSIAPQVQWTAEEERLWEVVNKNPKDADSSLALLTFVLKPNNPIEKIIPVYKSFLDRFPLAVQYRNNYADWLIYVGRNEDAIKLYEGVQWPVSCSVKFWMKYYELASSMRDYDYVHKLLHSAVLSVGSHPGSFSLWDSAITYEQNCGQWKEVSWLFSQAFANPVKGMDSLFDRFKELCKNTHLQDLMGWLDWLGYSEDACFGKLEYWDQVDSYIKDKKDAAISFEGEITDFESCITSSDFEVGKVELEAAAGVWHSYIDFMEREHPDKVQQLLERCLIPCATRNDLWLRYAEYLEDKHDMQAALSVLKLSFSHIKDVSVELFLYTAGLKERMKDAAGVRTLYSDAKSYFKYVPLEVLEAHGNFEHRMGNDVGAASVFQNELDTEVRNGSGLFSPALRLKYARFMLMVLRNPNKSKDILIDLLNLELSTPVVEGIIDIASALPEKERTEFLASLGQIMMKFILAEAKGDLLSEISDKTDVSLLYLKFLDYFCQGDTFKTATRRHLSRFRRSINLLPKRRLEAEIDFEIQKKMKIDDVSFSNKIFDVFTLSLPEFLRKYSSYLTEVKTLRVGVLNGYQWTRLTEIGRQLLKAIYKPLLQRHDGMLSWDGVFNAEDIIVTYDTSFTSIICSFRKEASIVTESWVTSIINDHTTLQNLLEPSFKSVITCQYPPYLAELFSFATSALGVCELDPGSRRLFLQQVAQHPALKSSSAIMSLCRELYLYIKQNNLWRSFNSFALDSSTAAHAAPTVGSSDKLVNQVCQTTLKLMGITNPVLNATWMISVIRHIESHSIDHMQLLSMSIDSVEDLYDLVNYHYSSFVQALIKELFEILIKPNCLPGLSPIMEKYSKSN